MKLRGLSAIVTTIILAALLGAGSYYLKSKNVDHSNDIKSQLTSESPSQNAATVTVNKPSALKNLIANTIKKQEEMTERKDFDNSVLELERFYTDQEIADMTEEEFTVLVQEIELKFPKLSDIKKLPPGALHRTPAPVLQAGKELGLLKEILKVHESYERVAVGFYERCAKSAERPTPVRALCLTNLVTTKKKNSEKVNLKEYPSELVELTRMITDL